MFAIYAVFIRIPSIIKLRLLGSEILPILILLQPGKVALTYTAAVGCCGVGAVFA